jgi:hypothetical protein
MIDSVRSFCQHGSSKGFSGLWMSGEMNWALKGYPGSERVAEYESRVNLLANELPIGGICQYDSRRFDGATLFDILQVHPFMIARGQVVHNPYYIPPESYICKPSASQ